MDILAPVLGILFLVATILMAFELRESREAPSCPECPHCRQLAEERERLERELIEQYDREHGINEPDREDRLRHL